MNNKLRILLCSLLATAAICSLVIVGCESEKAHTHTYGDPVWTWADDYSSATAKISCTDGDDTQTSNSAASTYSVTTEANCGIAGSGTYTVAVTLNGKTYTDTKTVEIPATGEHTYGDAEWTWAEDNGSATVSVTCSVCGNKLSESATVTSTTKDATCVGEGSAVYSASATLNGTAYTDEKTVTIPATGIHTYGEPDWVWAEDYSSATATVTCSVCGDKQSQKTETIGYKVTLEPTCAIKGKGLYTATVTISGTEYSTEKEAEIPKTEHTYGDAVWTWADDYSSATATVTCSVCGDEQNKTVTPVYEVETPATEEATGVGVYTATVTLEGKNYTDTKKVEIPVIKPDHTHTYGDAVWTWADDYTSATATVTCVSGDDELSETTETIGYEVTLEPNCIEKGKVLYTATVTINGTEYTDSTEVEVPATGIHTYGDPVWKWLDNYNKATATITCKVCGNQLSATGESEMEIIKEPICEQGVTWYTVYVTLNDTEYKGFQSILTPAQHDYQLNEDGYLVCTRCGEPQNKTTLTLGDNDYILPYAPNYWINESDDDIYMLKVSFTAEKTSNYTFSVDFEKANYYCIRSVAEINGSYYTLGKILDPDNPVPSFSLTLSAGTTFSLLVMNWAGSYSYANVGKYFKITLNISSDDSTVEGSEVNPKIINPELPATVKLTGKLAAGEKYYFKTEANNYYFNNNSWKVTATEGFDVYIYTDNPDLPGYYEYVKVEEGFTFTGSESYNFYMVNTGSSIAEYTLLFQIYTGNIFTIPSANGGTYNKTFSAADLTNGIKLEITNPGENTNVTIELSSDGEAQYIKLMDSTFSEILAGYEAASYSYVAELIGGGTTKTLGLQYFGSSTDNIQVTIIISTDVTQSIVLDTETSLNIYSNSGYFSYTPNTTGTYYITFTATVNGVISSAVPTLTANDETVRATDGVFTVNLTAGTAYKFVVTYEAGLSGERVKLTCKISSANGNAGVNYQEISLDNAVTIIPALSSNSYKGYLSYNAAQSGIYRLTFAGSGLSTIFNTSLTVNGLPVTYDSFGIYTLTLAANTEYKIVFTVNANYDIGANATLTFIEESDDNGGDETVNTLIVGENPVKEGEEYSFTSENGGTYVVTVSGTKGYSQIYASKDSYTHHENALFVEQEQESYTFTLQAGESKTFYTLNGGDGDFNLIIAESNGDNGDNGDNGGEDEEETIDTFTDIAFAKNASFKFDNVTYSYQTEKLTYNAKTAGDYTITISGAASGATNYMSIIVNDATIYTGIQSVYSVSFVKGNNTFMIVTNIAKVTQRNVKAVVEFVGSNGDDESNTFEVGESITLDENSVDKTVTISEAGNYIMKFTFESGLAAKGFQAVFDGCFSIGYKQYDYNDIQLSEDSSYAYIEFPVEDGQTGEVNVLFGFYEFSGPVTYSVIIEKV